MVRIVHNGQPDAGHSEAHQNDQPQDKPDVRYQSGKNYRVGNEIQRKHEDSFGSHFGISLPAYSVTLEVFIHTLIQRDEKILLVVWKFDGCSSAHAYKANNLKKGIQKDKQEFGL